MTSSTSVNRSSNAMVTLHKEQFGRGPTKAQTHLAGADALLSVMEDAGRAGRWRHSSPSAPPTGGI
jgi:uncharacterized protein YbcI